MKKQFLLLAAVIATTVSFAQYRPSYSRSSKPTYKAPELKTTFGVKAGLSSAGMRGDAVNSLKSLIDYSNGSVTTKDRIGFYAGGFANIPVDEMLSIEPAVYYTQRGYQLNGAFNFKGLDFVGANAKANLNLEYVDIPLLLKANMDGLQLFAGPQVSYLASANLHTTAGALGFNLVNNKMDASNQFNRWDAGVTLGVGYQFAGGVNFTAAYDHGMTKVDANRSMNAYNRTFKIGLGISL